MSDPIAAWHVASSELKRSRGYHGLSGAERAELDAALGRIGSVLSADPVDPFAVPLATPNELRGGWTPQSPPASTPQAPAAPAPKPPSLTDTFGQRTRQALDGIDFPAFVAGLIQGTFQAIVDATVQQVREYANLVASLAKTVDQFTADHVSPNQARDQLAERHPRELVLDLPRPGEDRQPRIVPRRAAEGTTPEWLADYGLAGSTLEPELVDGALVEAARRRVGEQRMQHLATLVLLGLNRIVVQDGQIRARLQFHAVAREKVSAEVAAQLGGQQTGIAGREASMQAALSTMVTTVQANAQTEDTLKADLMGEVQIKFRTETFDINRFADAELVGRINRHAKRPDEPAPTPGPNRTERS